MDRLRIIGDVHGQVTRDDLPRLDRRPYVEIVGGAPHSVQVGDMGDAETYETLGALVDPSRHRFFPGNHDHHGSFPARCLGDFGEVVLGGVRFFFIRGAASTDREKLVALGNRLGRTLWYEAEELTDDEMKSAEAVYADARPEIVLSHDGPTDAARAAFAESTRRRIDRPGAPFARSRTTDFLGRLLEVHRPRLWIFGHHHVEWTGWDGMTRFRCVSELGWVDITPEAEIIPGAGVVG
ncbi:metallophosphoesterase family protein [Aquisphaera insulae]|uniref:metallophosphoesterase family protein n=1 Tax=Aquisphaera insulae TaxID=2712864 RepID=UPI0013EC7F55|nr:metallophosphoesterase [Aquisphaera insulae]